MRHLLLRHPPDAIGRRGACLLIFGSVWVAYAASLLVRGHVRPTDLFALMPVSVQASLWLAAGVLAIWFAFQRRPGADTPGFLVIAPLAGVRAFAYGWSWLGHVLGVRGPTDSGAWFGAVVWLGVTFLAMTIAGWPEQRPERREGA